MKLLLISVLGFTSLNAQVGEELLVYSVKGQVTVVENNSESKLKIGKVLKPAAVIHTQKESKLTMVCKQGKPISVLQEGIFPVITWKDSCKLEHSSLTTNYFQYIWQQLYLRSPEGQEELKKTGKVNTIREGAPLRSEGEEIVNIRIEFNTALDTINYTEGDFPLTWSTPGYDGRFLFQLFNAKDGKLVFKDSVSGNLISLSRFSKHLQPGKTYRWLIGTKGVSVRKPRVIHCVLPATLKEFIDDIDSLDVPEDPAAVYFRIGYMLEKEHYYTQVLDYFVKAVKLDYETVIYREKLMEFCREFRVDLPDLD